MNSIDLIGMGFTNLLRRKARTFLTVLGVIIGTTSIIIMFSLGIGMNESFKKELEYMGSLNTIEVNKGYGERGPKEVKLDDKAILKFEKMKNVVAATPIYRAHGKFFTGRYESYATIIGIDISKIDKFDFKLEEGRYPELKDKNAIVSGMYIPQNFRKSRSRSYERKEIDVFKAKVQFTAGDTYDRSKKPKLEDVKIVGLLKESGDEKDYQSYMDISNLKKLVEKTQDKESSRRNGGSRTSTEYENALVKVDDINYVQEVNQKIKDMGFETYTLTDMLESMQKQYAGLMAVLGGIGGVSLFVAALGITNTMVMSIYERTREIGVIKVLGANIADIRRLFLFEAALIGFFGGIVGVILSYGVSYLMNKVGVNILGYYGGDSNMSVIPLWLSGFALLFSILIGLISGYYPARRAMKLSALEAIRTE